MNLVTGIAVILVISSVSVGLKGAIFDDLEEADSRVLRTRLEEERAERLLLRNDLDILMLKVTKLERQQKDDMSHQPPRMTKRSEPIAFTARRGGSHVLLDALHVLVFDHVDLNQGSGYNPATGIFTAPVTGTYIFSVSVMTVNDKNYAHLQLMVNDKEVGKLFCGDHTSSWHDQGSLTIVVQVEAKEQVYVREHSGLTGRINVPSQGF